MGPLDRELARRRGQRKAHAMKRRAGQLRWRVVATAVIGFAILWTVVFVQMATGNDPALGTGAVRPVATKKSAPEPEQPRLQPTMPPPSGDEEERVEAERIGSAEAERVEIEQIETEQREAEFRELEELEAVTTGQS